LSAFLRESAAHQQTRQQRAAYGFELFVIRRLIHRYYARSSAMTSRKSNDARSVFQTALDGTEIAAAFDERDEPLALLG